MTAFLNIQMTRWQIQIMKHSTLPNAETVFFTDIAKTLSKDFGYNNSLNSSESETELVEDEKVG
jgi:hypothetical protein